MRGDLSARGVTCYATIMFFFYFPRTICNRSSPACVLSSYQQYLLWSNAALANGHKTITDKRYDLHKFPINTGKDVSYREMSCGLNLWKLIIMIIFAFFYVLQWNVSCSGTLLNKTFLLIQIESEICSTLFAPSRHPQSLESPKK